MLCVRYFLIFSSSNATQNANGQRSLSRIVKNFKMPINGTRQDPRGKTQKRRHKWSGIFGFYIESLHFFSCPYSSS